MKTRYSKADYLKLLAAYATLKYDNFDAVALLADPFMVQAIQAGIWTPPAAPKAGAA